MFLSKETVRAAMLGLIVADAVGVPAEFSSRNSLKLHPITEMTGHGTYDQPEGTWSDDSSLALAAMDSLSSGWDLKDMMDRFESYAYEDAYTPYGYMFDIGNACRSAIAKWHRSKDELAPEECGGRREYDNGNGALMRILPTALYIASQYGCAESSEPLKLIHSSASCTHGHRISLVGCGIYSNLVCSLLKLQSRSGLTCNLQGAIDRVFSAYNGSGLFPEKNAAEEYHRMEDLARFANLPESEISGSGYVVSTLEAAVWCLLNTLSYRDCILKAVNLGQDTDTVAAVAGGLAGLVYGIEGETGIPQRWINKLAQIDTILKKCDAFSVSTSIG